MAKKISHQRMERARELVRRNPEGTTPAEQKAAAYFKLDLGSPRDRDRLLRALAEIVFAHGKRGNPHSTRKWDVPQVFKLMSRVDQLRRERPGIKDTEVGRCLKKRWPEYAKLDERSTLRHRIRLVDRMFEDMDESEY